MAAESNTSVDIEIWIEKVINSCDTLRHFCNAERLVRFYIKRLKNEGMPHYQFTHIKDKFEWAIDCRRHELLEK